MLAFAPVSALPVGSQRPVLRYRRYAVCSSAGGGQGPPRHSVTGVVPSAPEPHRHAARAYPPPVSHPQKPSIMNSTHTPSSSSPPSPAPPPPPPPSSSSQQQQSPSSVSSSAPTRPIESSPSPTSVSATTAAAAAAVAATVISAIALSGAAQNHTLGTPGASRPEPLTLAPSPINTYAQRRQELAYASYMEELERRFEAMSTPAVDVKNVVERGGGGLSVSYRVAGIAAFLASAASTAVVHPLDTLKTRIQARARKNSEDGSYPSSAQEDSALFTGLYTGIVSNILKEAPNAAIYLGVYELIKGFLLSTTAFHELPLLVFIIAGSMGDALGSIVRVPAEIVNKRLQLGASPDWYSAIHEAFLTPQGREASVVSWEAVLWRDVPFGGIQIALYEFGRQYIATHGSLGFLHPGTVADIVVGAIAGAIAAVVTTPADVLVTRLSVQNPQSYLETKSYMGVGSTLRRIVQEDGIGGLFAGFLQRGIYYAPLIGLFFALYEATRFVVSDPHVAVAALSSLQQSVGHLLSPMV